MIRATEQAVIGAAIIDQGTLDTMSGIITAADFSDGDLGQCFGLMVDLHAAGEAISDMATLLPKLRAAGMLDQLGGSAGIARLTLQCGNVRNAAGYAAEVKAAATRRRIEALGNELASRAVDPTTDPAELIAWADSQLTRHRSSGLHGSVSLAAAVKQAVDDIEAAQSGQSVGGCPTGLWRLDEAMGRLYAGDLVILAARPSIGKSALGAQIAIHNAEAGRPVLFVSLEMAARDIALRQIAARLKYEVRTLRAGCIAPEDIADARQYEAGLGPVHMYLWAQRSATVAKIRAAARVQKAATGLGLVVIDYLGLVAPTDPRKPRWENITEASSDLKSLALELDVPVLCLCQLNRQAEVGEPRLDHLRDAGAIEQDADVVMLLHRESRDSTTANINIAKARNGSTGSLTLGFDPAATRFTDDPEWEPCASQIAQGMNQ